MSAETYANLLRDPRWQRRRLEILQRSDFSCEECEDKENTLHVHHKLYRKGAMPWEYTNGDLQALCEHCHEEKTGHLACMKVCLAWMPNDTLSQVLGYCQGLAFNENWDEEIDGDPYIAPPNIEWVWGFLDAIRLKISPLDFWNMLEEDGSISVASIKKLRTTPGLG